MYCPRSALLSDSKIVDFNLIKHRYSTPLRLAALETAIKQSKPVLRKHLPDDIVRIVYGYYTVKIRYEPEDAREICLDVSHGHCVRLIESNVCVAICYYCCCRNPCHVLVSLGIVIMIVMFSTV
jgi:hypothetical protein